MKGLVGRKYRMKGLVVEIDSMKGLVNVNGSTKKGFEDK